MKTKIVLLIAFSTLIFNASFSQIITGEDSLNAGLTNRGDRNTILSGYGEAAYRNNLTEKKATANLTRAVLFVGYKFGKKITFFSELELEDGKVDASGGEISLEQCFLKFNANNNVYLTAGLFIPRIGIINENHLPTTFNTNTRPMLERKLVPATWRELGIGLYGEVSRIRGLNYSLALVNGLNSANFGNGTGIREGRFEGRDASASNLAVTGALLYYVNKFRFQVSGYYAGTAGMSPRSADSLQLNSGAFGTPVALTEANMQYNNYGVYFKGMVAYAAIPEADMINRAYANNTPSTMFGYYAELGYNILEKTRFEGKKLFAFARYENFDLNETVPVNGIRNEADNQYYVFFGLCYKPIVGVSVKVDYEIAHTGNPNPLLIVNPSPIAPKYLNTKNYLNIGVAYSF